ALRLARPEKKLPRLTVTAFTNLILTDQHWSPGSAFFYFKSLPVMAALSLPHRSTHKKADVYCCYCSAKPSI
ncbi:hypothetical protein WKH22_16455, partial [Pantoea agglomerans]|uniref:hypothetical protein n=1 Tax=Enterobacter agglomerans TaxID=549 RepID=UPI003C7E1C58